MLTYLMLTAISAIADGQPLFLYDTGNPNSKYLLSRTYDERANYRVSEVILCDSFHVQRLGSVCQVTMSNAFVYRTRINQERATTKASAFTQEKAFFLQLEIGFKADTKLIYNSTVTNLVDVKPLVGTMGRMTLFEGKALEAEMKRLGLKPPEDADMTRSDGK